MTLTLPTTQHRQSRSLIAAAGHLMRHFLTGGIVALRSVAAALWRMPAALQRAFTMAYVDPFSGRSRSQEFGTRPEDF